MAQLVKVTEERVVSVGAKARKPSGAKAASSLLLLVLFEFAKEVGKKVFVIGQRTSSFGLGGPWCVCMCVCVEESHFLSPSIMMKNSCCQGANQGTWLFQSHSFRKSVRSARQTETVGSYFLTPSRPNEFQVLARLP